MNRPLYTQFFPALLLLGTGFLCKTSGFLDLFEHPDDKQLLAITYALKVAGSLWLLTAGFLAGWRYFIKRLPEAPSVQSSQTLSPVSGD